jgi:hypothetical protein
VRRPVHVGRLEECHVVRALLMLHQAVDVPGRRRCPPGEVLRRNDDVEVPPRTDEVLAPLKFFSRVEKGAP